jgi:glucokinase
MRHVIGVDLGGTQLRAILCAEDGQIVDEVYTPTLAAEGPPAVITRMVGCIDQMRAALPTDAVLAGVGVGSPGPLDPFDGIVFYMPNLPGWHNVPLRAILEEQTSLPVELGNDANAAALGEYLFGGGRGYRNMVYVTVSTGIGGGVICDGRLLLGHRGAAAEVGHMIIQSQGRLSWEDLASGTALAREAAQVLKTDVQTRIRELTAGGVVTAAHVTRAALDGDPVALSLVEREGELLGVGLVNVLHLFSPEIVLLGGGVMAASSLLLERARRVIQERAMEVYRSVPVALAALGDRVGLLGAVAVFLEQHPLRGARA